MGFMRAVEGGARSLRQFLGGQSLRGLYHPPFGMNPMRFNRVEPGALDRQQARDQSHTLPRLLDCPVVGANPGAHFVADMPRDVIPDQFHTTHFTTETRILPVFALAHLAPG